MDSIEIFSATVKYENELIHFQFQRGEGNVKKIILETEDERFKPTYNKILFRSFTDPCYLYNEFGYLNVDGDWDKKHIAIPDGWEYQTSMTIEQFQKCGGVKEINKNGYKYITAVFHGLIETEKNATSLLQLDGKTLPETFTTQEFRTTIHLTVQTQVDASSPFLRVSKTSDYHFVVLEHSESILDETGAHQDSFISVNIPDIGTNGNNIFDHISVTPNVVTSPIPSKSNGINSIEFIILDPTTTSIQTKLMNLEILEPPNGFKKYFFLLRVYGEACTGFAFRSFKTSIEFFNSIEESKEKIGLDMMVGLPDICRDDFAFDLQANLNVVYPLGTPIILTQPIDLQAVIESKFIPIENVYIQNAKIIVQHEDSNEDPYIFTLVSQCNKFLTLDHCLTDLGESMEFGYLGNKIFSTTKSISSFDTQGKSYKAIIPIQITFGINMDNNLHQNLIKYLENVNGKASIQMKFLVDFVNIDDNRRKINANSTRTLEIKKEILVKNSEEWESSSTNIFLFSFLVSLVILVVLF